VAGCCECADEPEGFDHLGADSSGRTLLHGISLSVVHRVIIVAYYTTCID
jgi:hypothetical protein